MEVPETNAFNLKSPKNSKNSSSDFYLYCIRIQNASIGSAEINKVMLGKQCNCPKLKSDIWETASQAYSLLVKAYYSNKPPPQSDQPFSSYRELS